MWLSKLFFIFFRYQNHIYNFDECFEEGTSNKALYDSMIRNVVLSALQGINATVFMYGQTGAGKTYSMLGENNNNNQNIKNCENDEGILLMGLSEIMDEIKKVQ